MELIYVDEYLLVCVKPAGVLSTDEPGGVPELAREALGDPQAEVRTVHRLDRVVSGQCRDTISDRRSRVSKSV